MGVEIVLPEVYSLNTSPQPSPTGEGVNLSGEDLTQTWGIQQYQTYKYFENISENSKKIRVGVVDTGIDYNHPDLKQNVNRAL